MKHNGNVLRKFMFSLICRRRISFLRERNLALYGYQNHMRLFWGWGKDDHHNPDSGMESRNEKNQLVAQYGDNAPKPSPLLILPVQRPVFPGAYATTIVKNDKTIDAILSNRDNGNGYLAMFLRTDLVSDTTIITEIITSIDDIYRVGTLAQIQNIRSIGAGDSIQLILTTHRRVTLENINSFGPPIIGNCTHWDRLEAEPSPSVKAYSNELIAASRYVPRTLLTNKVISSFNLIYPELFPESSCHLTLW